MEKIKILTVEVRKAEVQQLSQEIDIFWEELKIFAIQDRQKLERVEKRTMSMLLNRHRCAISQF